MEDDRTVLKRRLVQFHPRILYRGPKRHKHPHGLQQRRHRLTNEGLVEVTVPEEVALLEGKCKKILEGTCTNSSCDNWLPFVCQNYKSDPDANSPTSDCSDTLRVMVSPVKSRRKVVERISCFIEGVCTIVLCIQGFLSEKIYSAERGKIGIKTHRQILQGHVVPKKNTGKKRSIARNHS